MTPTTKAGQTLLVDYPDRDEGPRIARSIAAIEAEARVALLAEIRREVHALDGQNACFCDFDRSIEGDGLYVKRDAVLAVIAKAARP